jgi:hypothetical protein
MLKLKIGQCYRDENVCNILAEKTHLMGTVRGKGKVVPVL